jgi:alkylhydroperoxidase family enzyme
MDIPRIASLSVEEAITIGDENQIPRSMAELSVFRVALRSPAAARAINDLLGNLMAEGSLEVRLRELVIMRIAWVKGSGYEWSQHWNSAQRRGVPEEDLAAVRLWPESQGFGEADQAVLQATDELLATGAISDVTWDRCRAALKGDAPVLELITAIGAWSLIALFLRALEIPLDEGMAVWPPDGMAPPGA